MLYTFTIKSYAIIQYGSTAVVYDYSPHLGPGLGEHWQTNYQGAYNTLVKFGNAAGTIIGPHTFITSAHVGGVITQAVHYTYNGSDYVTHTTNYVNPGSGIDLRIWIVQDVFPEAIRADIYTGNGEVGMGPFVSGRSVYRPDASQSIVKNSVLKGWRMAANASNPNPPITPPITWGLGYVAGVASEELGDGIGWQTVLQMSFNASWRSLATYGDSGGGVLAYIDGKWTLIGVVASSSQHVYNWYDPSVTTVCDHAAIIDKLGLKYTNTYCDTSDPTDNIGGGMVWYAIRVKQHESWINMHKNDLPPGY